MPIALKGVAAGYITADIQCLLPTLPHVLLAGNHAAMRMVTGRAGHGRGVAKGAAQVERAFTERTNVPKTPAAQALKKELRDAKRLVGRGGFGRVFSCSHISAPGMELAAKIIELRSARDAEAVRREAEMLQRMGAARIAVPKFHQLIFEADIAYLIMGRAVGDTLESYFGAEPRKTMEERLRLVRLESWLEAMLAVAMAIARMHSKFFTHADLKGANIFVEFTPGMGCSAMIIDAGMVHKTAPGFVAQYACGTWAYCPPQVLDNKLGMPTDVNRRKHDVYSFGIMLYQDTQDGESRVVADLYAMEVADEARAAAGEAPVLDGLRQLLTELLADEEGRRPAMPAVVERLQGCLEAVMA
ncbi:hypothetical protein WJX81_001886 [Elliptochloris bilobata]|uniref:Protein kinase domain-containing protein n=1 Tax=Elliptochloris bilobata TaxID=381761 RepID=A0AAW1RIQ0_9CHLO